jgi:hypothetical protein
LKVNILYFICFIIVQVDGKKKRAAKEEDVYIPSSDDEEEEDFSSETEDEEEGADNNDFKSNIEETDDGSNSDESGAEENENSANAERQVALLKDKLEKEKGKKKASPPKRKVTPIKIKELAKKAKLMEKEKQKTPRKKKDVQVQPMDTSVQPSTSAQASVAPTTNGQQPQQGENEKEFDVNSLSDKKKTREAPVFNDKNLDYNLFQNAPENVISKKIKISSNVIMTCRMIDGSEGRKTASSFMQDYAALSFLRKTKDEKAFEFNLPLNLAPNIMEALKLIMNDNPKFFQKYTN